MIEINQFLGWLVEDPLVRTLGFSLIGSALTACSRLSSTPAVPEGIDHLVFAVPDLGSGMDEVEEKLGVRPVLGGQHPSLGTHNALLSFGPSTYLEVIAPDPTLLRPKRGVVFGVDKVHDSRLLTWALRVESLESKVDRASEQGLDLGPIQTGRRESPDGSILSWQLTDPYAMPFDGCIPFLISWGKTLHPASSAPRAGELIGFRLEHPEPNRVGAALAALGVEVTLKQAKQVRLIVTIRCGFGEVILE